MSKPNVILTGFMATGKSTIGRLLAIKLDYKYVDTDELIVSRAGQSVDDIFQNQGEEAFRKMESSIAEELGRREGLVISTGGKLMLDEENAAALGKTGRVFCLVATPEEILYRVSNDKQVKRPLLESPNPMERIVELMRQRNSAYSRFPKLVTSGKTPEELTGELVDILQAEEKNSSS